MSEVLEHTFDNRLRLVAERIDSAQSLALSMLMPAGVVHEPADRLGVAPLLAEMICRGAGDLDAKAHSDALDQLGVQRATGVDQTHLRLGASMIHSRLGQALPLLMDMVRRPRLDPDPLEPSRDLAIQAIEALEDEPQQKVFLTMRRRHFPQPFGRSPMGEIESLERISLDDLRRFWRRTFVPEGAILGVAGRFDWDELRGRVGELLGDWSGTVSEPAITQPPPRGYSHEKADSVQLHIGLAYDAVPEPDPQSLLQRAAAAVLSGGMSGRLFTEVREKRGLCYAVFASYAGSKRLGAMLAYAGTTAPRAQETYDVLRGELVRLSEGIEADEFQRAIVGMKSRLVMQGESTGARAAAIARDIYIYGRPRRLEELAAEVDAITLDALRDYVAAHPPDTMTVVTIGPEPLELSPAS